MLVVSAGWGFWLALATSVASATAYVWFHALEGSGSLVPAVVVFSVLALLTNVLVGQSRLRALESDQRRREADLSAAMARTVLRAADPPEALAAASARLSDVLELPAPGAILGDPDAECGRHQECIMLRDDDRTVGSLVVPSDISAADRRRVLRMVPNLEALLAAARDREVLYGRTIAMARQQAALRRVATLVASRVEPGEVFRAVTDELADELGVEHVTLVHFDSDGSCDVLAARDDEAGAESSGLIVGERIPLGGKNISTAIFETGDTATLDYSGATGPIGERLKARGIRSGIGVPITVEGHPWGAVIVGITHRSAPPDLRLRLTDFADLVARAVFNDESRAALNRSRARVIAAADQARRAIERDLHDGAQQRIVSLGMDLRAVQATVPEEQSDLRGRLDTAVDSLSQIHTDLQELSRGIHPAILSRGGLAPALKTLARRSPVPVSLDIAVPGRLPEPVEVTAYYVVAESLTNTAKYAQASEVNIAARIDDDDVLVLSVADDGVGGALPDRGSGLIGLRDRVEAVEGTFNVGSSAGVGTTVRAEIPLTGATAASTTG
ncbi:GAF domain-containing sensor histidine kinase [Gordonia sp. NPDC127522]|uniref:GAF domain-containing sensor histidine kinase n=1 Tax=Gordonia sp. NPDC127522 TaxID=3345390 RepID=UPI003632E2DB